MTKLGSVILGVSVLLVSQGAWAKCEHISDKSSQAYKECMAKKTGKTMEKCYTGTQRMDKPDTPSKGSGSSPASSSHSGIGD